MDSLSAKQREVYDAVTGQGAQSVMITGAAGTGKTYLLQRIIRTMRNRGKRVCVTGSTGVAALAVSGMTLHSFAGIGPWKKGSERKEMRSTRGALVRESREEAEFRGRAVVYRKVRFSQARERWWKCDMLVIDEISMISADLFDMLEWLAKKMRSDLRPFGGIQLVLCGDFLQLPPVGSPHMAFEAECWGRCLGGGTHELTQNHRQGEDKLLAQLLQRARVGRIGGGHVATLARCVRAPTKPAVVLCPLRHQTQRVNTRNLAALSGAAKTYAATDRGPKKHLIEKTCLAPTHLHLKVGARVMLLANVDIHHGMVNGSTGTVVSVTDGVYPSVLFDSKKAPKYPVTVQPYTWQHTNGCDETVLAERKQVPLMLGWAVTIHKSQSMTMDSVVVHLDKLFETGQCYTALSRVRSLDGLFLVGRVHRHMFKANEKAVKYYKTIVV